MAVHFPANSVFLVESVSEPGAYELEVPVLCLSGMRRLWMTISNTKCFP
jgi:hypothetical protein